MVTLYQSFIYNVEEILELQLKVVLAQFVRYIVQFQVQLFSISQFMYIVFEIVQSFSTSQSTVNVFHLITQELPITTEFIILQLVLTFTLLLICTISLAVGTTQLFHILILSQFQSEMV
jgi:hypothetical protein